MLRKVEQWNLSAISGWLVRIQHLKKLEGVQIWSTNIINMWHEKDTTTSPANLILFKSCRNFRDFHRRTDEVVLMFLMGDRVEYWEYRQKTIFRRFPFVIGWPFLVSNVSKWESLLVLNDCMNSSRTAETSKHYKYFISCINS